MVKVPGTELTVGGRQLVFAPLNAASFKQYRDRIQTTYSGGLPDMEFVATLAHCSLKRNYDDISADDCLEFIDAGNYMEVFETVMNVSGLAVAVGNMMRRLKEAMESAQAQQLPSKS